MKNLRVQKIMSHEEEEEHVHKGLTKRAKIWEAYIASNVKTKDADNANQYILFGQTLLDKSAFNDLNDGEHDYVHGVQVFYGPFDTKDAMKEFVTDYPDDLWPGPDDWRYRKLGKPIIVSSFADPSKADIVHNKSLPFQGQIAVNEMRKRVKEQENLQKRLGNRKIEEMKDDELKLHIGWQKERIQQTEKDLEGMRAHLSRLERDAAK